MLMVGLGLAAAAGPTCHYALDPENGDGRHGEYRSGSYFKGVVDVAATSSAQACAAQCCNTDGCDSFSLNVPWTDPPWLGCETGEPCCVFAAGAGPFMNNTTPMNITTGTVQAPPSTGKAPGANRSFDCAIRELAYEYAQSVRPDMAEFAVVHDGLQLEQCGSALGGRPGRRKPKPPPAGPRSGSPSRSALEFFVSVDGSDAAVGTQAAPFATPMRGVLACRAAAVTSTTTTTTTTTTNTADAAAGCTVTLRAGTFYFADSPLELTAGDSGLTLRSFAGEVAELSGGEPITGLAWTKATIADATASPNVTVWQAPFRAPGGGAVAALRLKGSGRRVTRARHPNADPETMGARRSSSIYEGWLPAAGPSWYPAAPGPSPGVDYVSGAADWPGVDWSHHMQMANGLFTIGAGGGRCDDLASGVAYWCGATIPRGNNYLHRGPGGLRNPAAVLPGWPYQQPEGMVVHMWADAPARGDIGPWFTLQWEVGAVGVNGTLDFAPGGGTQGSEGWIGDGELGAWAVENALELLDAENEFFHDAVNDVIYWAPNTTSDDDGGADADPNTPPADDALIAVRGKVILSVTGSQAAPVRNVSLVGLVFRDAAPTFLDRHDVPSQGDWALVHTAAVVARGTEGFLMKGCLVTRADGQGVLLEGYHRDAVLLQNEFELIGSHAMVSWGQTSDCLDANCSRKVPGGGDGPDGRNGDQPIGTLVEANIVHETGIYERQGTMWNQALTAKTTLKNNIFFNCDRASLNVNDGFGGGNMITGNLLFNTGRAANKDEGSINTWDRAPYITTLRNGTASTIPAWNYINNNFFIANYNPSLAIDNDDGSSWYQHHENFVVYGQAGFKADFGAHNMHAVGNFYAYVDVSWGGWPSTDGFFVNNSVILGGETSSYFGLGYSSDCGLIGHPELGEISGNTIYSNGPVMVPCSNATVKSCSLSCPLQSWVEEGHDIGTTLRPTPPDMQVVAAAKVLLGLKL